MADLVEGYVHAWYSQSETWKFAVAPHAFSWFCKDYGKGIPLVFRHLENVVFAKRNNGTLSLWSDSYGLAFCARLEDRSLTMLEPDLTKGRLGCSMELKFLRTKLGFLDGPYPRNATVDELVAKPLGELVTRCSLHEVTVTDTPGFEGNACWLASAGPYDLPRHVQELRERWRAGCAEADRDAWPMSAEDEKDRRRDEREAAEKAAKVVPLHGGRGRAFASGYADSALVEGLVWSGWTRQEALAIEERQQNTRRFDRAFPKALRRPK